MTKMRRCRRGVTARGAGALLASVMLMGAPAAQEGDRFIVDVGDCVELVTPEERLACFDARVERARQGGAQPPAREPAASATAGAGGVAPSSDPTAVFRREQRERPDPDVPLVVATVTALRETVPNSYVITLDNGQVWRQVQPLRYLLRVGMQIQIYPRPWGDNQRLKATDLRGYIQVERVR